MRATLVLLITTLAAAAGEPVWRAGVAARVITPTAPVWMAGYAARTGPATGKQHDLFAKALALEDSVGRRVVLLTSDLCGIPGNLADDVTREVITATGLPRSAIMLTCSHTHSGPVVRGNLMDMYDLSVAERDRVDAYYPVLKAAMADVILAALKNLAPATLAFGQGEAGFAVNRRANTAQGVVIGVDEGGPVDSSVPVLAVRKTNGTLVAAVFGYACHNTTLAGAEYSGDYAGFAQIKLEKNHPGVTALFWSGCGADANPNPRREVAHARKHGEELANAVDAVLAKPMTPLTKPVSHFYREIALDYAAAPTREEFLKRSESKVFAEKTWATRHLSQLAAGTPIDAAYAKYPVQSWRFGDELTWVALGGEVVVDYALRLKKEHPGPLWVTAYANDVMAYIPSERVLKEGGYEADGSMVYYGLPSKWKAGLEEKIVRTVQAGDKPLSNGAALSVEKAMAAFQLVPGYRIDCVAAEPLVIDPVAFCFDHTGALFVCEMTGYPNGGVATGVEARGRIRKLTDTDGDGVYDKATVFADKLRFPTGICCWRNGVIVCNAPDITFLRDTNNDGVADKSEVLYTGFDLRNIQTLPNSLQFHRDGWIYGMVGASGGDITCPANPGPPLLLRGRGFRFQPDTPGKFEPTSGGGQYGLTHDDRGTWFTNTNAQHLRQIVIADDYLRRNPWYAAPAVTADIAEHGPAAKIFRISPFEAWRLERTTRRLEDKFKKLPAGEMVPGGYFTSACSPLCYVGLQFEPRTALVCDPANNLVHRERLEWTDTPLFVAKRIDADREFLASTDNWFRPVFLAQGPDDALYVADFYREVIETPLSLPEDMKKRMNLGTRGRGRIWRIAKVDNPPRKFELVSGPMTHWQRTTRERMIFENGDAAVTASDAADLTLRAALKKLTADDVAVAIASSDDPRLLKLAEPFLETGYPRLTSVVRKRLAANSPRVRFQAILSLGADPQFAFTMDELTKLQKDLADPWMLSAVMVTMLNITPEMLLAFVADAKYPPAFVKQAATVHAAKSGEFPVALFERDSVHALEGVVEGLRQSGKTLDKFWQKDPDVSKRAAAFFDHQTKIARSATSKLAARQQALRLLELQPESERVALATTLLTPEQSIDIQIAAVRLLSSATSAAATDTLLKAWPAATPKLRVTLEEELFGRPARIAAVLAAVEVKRIDAGQISLLRADQLRNHADAVVRAQAAALFAANVAEDRKKVIEDYKPSLELTADRGRGKAVFAKTCASCHRLADVGNDVGANLTAALPNKTKNALLIDILDPSREVDPRYVNYTVQTQSGRTVTGVLAVETANAITLRRAEKAEDTVLRSDIESLKASKKSLMPEDLEKTLSKQDLADLMEYLVTVGK